MPSLQHKLECSRSFLEALLSEHGSDRVVVAWTGGKDSTVALSLWRKVLAEAGVSRPARAINLDTGYKFPEILAFRDHWAKRWGLDLTIVRPDPAEIPEVVARDPLTCCKALKIEPLRRALTALDASVLVTGVRADENPARTAPEMLTAKRDPDHLQANPVLQWGEMDIWAYTVRVGLPWCELYAKGYRSLGCVPCTRPAVAGGERAGRDQRKESRMADLRALGYF